MCGAGAGRVTVTVNSMALELTEHVPSPSANNYGHWYTGVAQDAGWSGGEAISVAATGGDGGFYGGPGAGLLPPFGIGLTAPSLIAGLNFIAPTTVPFGNALPVTWTPGTGTIVISAYTPPFAVGPYDRWTSEVRCTVAASLGSFTIPAAAMRELGLVPGVTLAFERTTATSIDSGVPWPVQLTARTMVGPMPLQISCTD
jgi:hypothetical protein